MLSIYPAGVVIWFSFLMFLNYDDSFKLSPVRLMDFSDAFGAQGHADLAKVCPL